jgi:hypothetical protein
VSLDPAIAAHAVGGAGDAIVTLDHWARHVAGFHAAVDSGHFAHGGAVARVQALTASGGRLVLGLSLGLLAGQDGQPSGVVGVLRRLGEAAVEFVTPEEGSA